MIYVESKRRSIINIEKTYPRAIIIDVTGAAVDKFRRFSPFFPHGNIPVPFSDLTSMTVEGIWQGLKVFETSDIDVSSFSNDTMKNLKRTCRRYGKCLGHKNMMTGELISYIEARKQIYLPSYIWMLKNKCSDLISELSELSKKNDVVLLDYDTNGNINDPSKPLSHASIIKAYIEKH